MNEIIIGSIIFIPQQRMVNKNGSVVKLRNKESELLSLLCSHYPDCLSREMIEKEIWVGSYVTDNTLTQTISNLRNALDDKAHELVITIPKKGYCIAIKPNFISNNSLDNTLPSHEYVKDNLENESIIAVSTSVRFIDKFVIALVFFIFLFSSFKITSCFYQIRILDVKKTPVLVNLDKIQDKDFLSVYNKDPYVYLKKQKNGEYTLCKYQHGGLTCEKK